VEAKKIQELLKELVSIKVDDVVAFKPAFLNIEGKLILVSLQANVPLALNVDSDKKDEEE
tara:strand:- start:252 stop:431 length:180 start_codon:yes stop_codon:yes gene_type:complete